MGSLPIVPFKADRKMVRDIRRVSPHMVHVKFRDQTRGKKETVDYFIDPIFLSSPISPGGSRKKWSNIHKIYQGKKLFEMWTKRIDDSFITPDL